MATDRLKDISRNYDVIVIGSGLGGLTSANYLAKQGYSVLLLEHHYQYGGLASWFRRKHKHIFDISLHGFPYGMIKSCRKYWTVELASMIHPIRHLRFVNPEYNLDTSFDREDFSRILVDKFKVDKAQVDGFFEHIQKMNFYNDIGQTTEALFETFFPDRNDVHRLLMEPITYANGSTMEDPAITYGIVFSNFMAKGVYIFRGGSDLVIGKMVEESQRNGVEMRKLCNVEKILLKGGQVTGVIVNGQEINSQAVVSNANLKNTLFGMLGEEFLPKAYAQEAKNVRLNTSSCQVYIGIKEGESIPNIGDLVFTSQSKTFSDEELKNKYTTSRTFSVYYPDFRPQNPNSRYAIVASINAKWYDWANLSDEDYQQEKDHLIQETLMALEQLIPNIRKKIDWVEAATPRTINRFTKHCEGTSFGTKFEGLKVSMELPENVRGLYHVGSVGIIMSGWLGTINYGVIVANKVDKFLSINKMLKETV